jgi:hypothetical protein
MSIGGLEVFGSRIDRGVGGYVELDGRDRSEDTGG